MLCYANIDTILRSHFSLIMPRGGTKASRAQDKLPSHHFYLHKLYIVNLDGDFQGWNSRIPASIWCEWDKLSKLQCLREPSTIPLFLDFSIATVRGHTHNADWYAQKSHGILLIISYLLWITPTTPPPPKNRAWTTHNYPLIKSESTMTEYRILPSLHCEP